MMKKLIISILFLFLLPHSAMATAVCFVHDGDTFTLCDGTKIRTFGDDAPELVQPFGYQSRDYLRTLILNKDVSLDCSHGRSYQRKVCGVVLNGQDIEAKMVTAGMAYDYPKYSHGLYKQEEQIAILHKAGVWVQGNPLMPWDFRRRK